MAFRNGRSGGRGFGRDLAGFEGQRGPKKSRRRRPGARRRKAKGGRSQSAEYQRGFRAALEAAGYSRPPEEYGYESEPGYAHEPGSGRGRGDRELRGRARRIGYRL